MKWKLNAPSRRTQEELPQVLDTMENDAAFTRIWSWQVLDNECIGTDEITLSVDELRRVAAFWMGIGIGAKGAAMQKEQVAKGLQSARG